MKIPNAVTTNSAVASSSIMIKAEKATTERASGREKGGREGEERKKRLRNMLFFSLWPHTQCRTTKSDICDWLSPLSVLLRVWRHVFAEALAPLLLCARAQCLRLNRFNFLCHRFGRDAEDQKSQEVGETGEHHYINITLAPLDTEVSHNLVLLSFSFFFFKLFESRFFKHCP